MKIEILNTACSVYMLFIFSLYIVYFQSIYCLFFQRISSLPRKNETTRMKTGGLTGTLAPHSICVFGCQNVLTLSSTSSVQRK